MILTVIAFLYNTLFCTFLDKIGVGAGIRIWTNRGLSASIKKLIAQKEIELELASTYDEWHEVAAILDELSCCC